MDQKVPKQDIWTDHPLLHHAKIIITTTLPVFVVIDGLVDRTGWHGALRVAEIAAGHIHTRVRHLYQLSTAFQAFLGVRRGRKRATGSGTLLDAARAEVQQLHSTA